MNRTDERDLDTWQCIDRYIDRLSLYGRRSLRVSERRDIERLLRRYRKLVFGSTLTDTEREAGWAEINP